jgi:serine/threonine protein phosphatase PrpC
MTIALKVGAATDPGRVRSLNEDTALVEEGLFAVADGMGGHVAGAVFDRANDDPDLRGMGTTICAVALVDHDDRPQLLIANVGDSRVYVFRGGELVQISEDHSWVREMEREGRLTADEAWLHPRRNIVTRVLGERTDVDVDEFWLDPYRGDRVLLCSDGLSDMIRDDDIARVLRTDGEPSDAAADLVRLANDAGGRDNITVVLIDVIDDGGKAETASASLAGVTTTSQRVERIVDDEGRHHGTGTGTEAVVARRPRRQVVTWRSALFGVALLAVVVIAFGGTWWFARSSWFVGLDRGRVALFRGRPDGVLFFDPTVEQRTRLHIDDVPPARRAAVEDRHEFATKAAGVRFLGRLRSESTTTTTTTTNVPGQSATPAAETGTTVASPTTAP